MAPFRIAIGPDQLGLTLQVLPVYHCHYPVSRIDWECDLTSNL